MPRLDIELIKRKIHFLEDDLKNLKRFNDLLYEDYLKNEDTKAVVERTLEKLTGRLIDINYHILKTEYEILPVDYRDSFIEMGKIKILTESVVMEISKAAGLRNALAHEYDVLDDKKVYDSIHLALIQVPKYLQEILGFLEK